MQKQLLLSLLFSVLCFNLQAQWSLSGNSNATGTSKLGTTNAIPLRLFTNNVARIYLATDGKAGIGTSSPQQRLHVEGTSNQAIFVNTSAVGALSGSGMIGYAKELPAAAGNRLGYFLLGSRGGAEANYNTAGMVGYAAGAWTAGSSHPAYLSFETTAPGSTTRSERLRIDAAGYMLPGTAAAQDLGSEMKQWERAYLSSGFSIGPPGTYAAVSVVNATTGRGISVENTYRGDSHLSGVLATSVQGDGYGYGVSAEGGRRGVNASAHGRSSSAAAYGVYGSASGSTGVGDRYGVYGYAYGGGTNIGVYGYAHTSVGTSYAGYFVGRVHATSFTTTSDRKFKTDIKPLTSALTQLQKLRPTTYRYMTKEYKQMNLPEGKQMGLVADEVKQVFPNLVEQAVHPAQYDEETLKEISPEVKFEGVNYQGLIPVLVASVQEQQQQLEEKDRAVGNTVKQAGGHAHH